MIITHLVEIALQYLYKSFARFYDLVAALVSFGRWKEWVFSVRPFLNGPCILELGFGPGHLLEQLHEDGYQVIGIDASRQMTRLAQRRIKHRQALNGQFPDDFILRGFSQAIPLQSSTFNTVYATFPTAYIFHPQTLENIHRVLTPDGKLVILVSALPRRSTLAGKLLYILYRITGQTPGEIETLGRNITERFSKSGFTAVLSEIDAAHAELLLISALPSKKTRL